VQAQGLSRNKGIFMCPETETQEAGDVQVFRLASCRFIV